MVKFACVMVVVLVVNALCEDYNVTIENRFSLGIVTEMRSMLVNGTVMLTGGCPEVKPTHVQFLLYNRQNSTKPVHLNADNMAESEIDPAKPIKVLIHGWMSDINSDGLIVLKDAYLKRYDSNVIAVNWSQLAKQFYTTAFCDLPGVAELVGDFLCSLSKSLNVQLSLVHVLGHSMGAQVSGIAGQIVQSKCGQMVGRITAMDPAGPLYRGLPEEQRLDETDANFVDVLHTNAGKFGYGGRCGTADFYVNCGMVQLQCPGTLDLSLSGMADLMEAVVDCNHVISWYYMAESINDQSDKFQATSCSVCRGLVCAPEVLSPSYSIMGEKCPTDSNGRYVLFIRRSPLYTSK